jgi:hypothetical protein
LGKASAPAAPDPTATANAQTASNKETAIAQANLNQVDQVNPTGSLKYTQIGTNADGTPKYQATTTYAPKAQGIYDAGQNTQQNLANVAQEQSGRIGGLLNAPLDFSAQKQYLEGLTSGALDKSWAKDQASLDTKLANQGIKLGSTAYDRAQNEFGVTKSDAYNSANVNNYNTALQSQLALRSQPLNEIAALASGSQIAAPQFGSTPQTGVGGTDVAGLTNQAYQNQVNAVNQANGQTNQMLGGLFSSGANLLPLAFSDERLKENIEPTGAKVAGVPVVEYDRKDTGQHEVGVIAQALRKKRPDLVDNSHPSGMLRVNYGKLMGAS